MANSVPGDFDGEPSSGRFEGQPSFRPVPECFGLIAILFS